MGTLDKYTLKVYMIHDESIVFREEIMNNMLKTLRIACDAIGMRFASVIIKTPTVGSLQANINDLSSKVKYEKMNDPEFDNRMSMLSIEQISNIQKHKEAWSHISNDNDDNTVYMVLEDDAFIMNEFANNIVEFLQTLPTVLLSSRRMWDICFLGNTQKIETQNTNKLQYTYTRNVAKILPSKESYVIVPSITRRLINSFENFRYTLRIHLSWFLHTNQDIRSVFPTKPIILDGSKIGICTTTIHPFNPLVLNREFVELWQMQNKEDITMSQIRTIYKKLEHLKSPDVFHIYAKLLVEKGLYMDADDAFTEAIRLVRMQNGFLNPGSQLLNDAINNCKYFQRDISEYKKKPSKYTEPDLEIY